MPSDTSRRDVPDSLTLQQAADRLEVHYMTAYRYVRTGRLPAEKRGGVWQVAGKDLEHLLSTRQGPNAARSEAAEPTVPAGLGEPGSGTGRQAIAKRLERRLLAGDEAGAWTLIEDVLGSGGEPAQIHVQLLVPALRSIGARWEDGDLTIADEHRASGVAARLVARLGPRFAVRGRTRGTVLVGCPAGERHALASAIAADLVRGAGFSVVDLGADVPAPSFADAARAVDRLVAVAVGASTTARLAAVAEAVAALRQAAPGVPVVVGGAAVADAELARRLGADRWSGGEAEGLRAAIVQLSRPSS